MPISDFCRKEVVTVDKRANIYDAAELMREQSVGSLIVTEGEAPKKRPVGILTDRDIVTMVVAKKIDPQAVYVEDLMTRNLIVANASDGILKVTEKMQDTGIRRLPVVDAGGMLMGVISIGDIYQILSKELGNLSRISRLQIHRERTGTNLTERFH